ncbi:hypothetical protein ADIAG_02204 [Paeniglutamicibacter gangotriensis Lz1y]|uniref:Uncharacterized protein n=1 Tax=Paeniglutamicibacter gangotriensis Lz1y TaxID=1276920 RepID=M7NI26_9MICC|nr:hypothetical protein ADIAG_02204 [Paeniglutamicibacter gangotriensis Lz1y]
MFTAKRSRSSVTPRTGALIVFVPGPRFFSVPAACGYG